MLTARIWEKVSPEDVFQYRLIPGVHGAVRLVSVQPDGNTRESGHILTIIPGRPLQIAEGAGERDTGLPHDKEGYTKTQREDL